MDKVCCLYMFWDLCHVFEFAALNLLMFFGGCCFADNYDIYSLCLVYGV